ncbi:uncharacterized protein LOC111486017 [Cucurbita maxima]|uniref:Uncharacterized protein LOC111486017 n=1 Tax=Cucurbita maxima TaxID=3661 RepID=A0A6J1JKJ0_CUCMA|nr:uncharacterized protein LOC111486017 [Cucurbita maxima]
MPPSNQSAPSTTSFPLECSCRNQTLLDHYQEIRGRDSRIGRSFSRRIGDEKQRYLAPRPVTVFRNRLPRVDGGLTLFMPPTSASQTVRVCAFPATRLGFEGIGISPDCNPENRAGPRELFNWAGGGRGCN